jgi:hypothetical protein
MLFKKIKVTKRYKGGGGGAPAPVSTIPDWAIPYMKDVGDEASNLYKGGALDNVANVSDLQGRAFTTGADGIERATTGGLSALEDQQARLTNLAQAPSAEVLAATKAGIVNDAQGRVADLNTNFGGAGTLGSGRQAVMQGAQNAQTVGALAKVDSDYENKMFQNRLAAEQAIGGNVGAAGDLASSGASGLANLGNQQRSIDQQQQDADYQGLQRYASTIYGNPARQQASGGGGK